MERSLKSTRLEFEASRSTGRVSAIVTMPERPSCALVFAHGAGAGMNHPFMQRMSEHLAEQRIATFRYQFPYMEKGIKRPDPKPILLATVRSAVKRAVEELPGVPVFAGGKSMGGRMTSLAVAESALENVQGLIFFGFPLHSAGSPSTERAEHLRRVNVPMLFLQGTRDSLADLSLLKPVCSDLGSRATLHIFDGADHSFHVPKKSGRTDDEVLEEISGVVARWAKG